LFSISFLEGGIEGEGETIEGEGEARRLGLREADGGTGEAKAEEGDAKWREGVREKEEGAKEGVGEVRELERGGLGGAREGGEVREDVELVHGASCALRTRSFCVLPKSDTPSNIATLSLVTEMMSSLREDARSSLNVTSSFVTEPVLDDDETVVSSNSDEIGWLVSKSLHRMWRDYELKKKLKNFKKN
jgi:hypothetical protein